MNTRTSIALFAATALATRLLGGGLSPQQPTEVRDVAAAGRAPAVTAKPANAFASSNRLRERLRVPAVPERGRNPFMYGARPTSREAPARADAPVVSLPALPPAPALPPVKLTGIASDQKDGARIITAILNEHGAIVFVKEGDRLSSGYTVVKVDEMSVTLVDASGVTMTLRLP